MIIRIKKWSDHEEKERARWRVLCAREHHTEAIPGAQNGNECKMKIEERRKGLRSTHTSAGALKGWAGVKRAKFYSRVTILTEVPQWEVSSSHSKL